MNFSSYMQFTERLNANITEDAWLTEGMNFLWAAQLMCCAADVWSSAWEQASDTRSNTERRKHEIRNFNAERLIKTLRSEPFKN
jgi:hypothetical protein